MEDKNLSDLKAYERYSPAHTLVTDWLFALVFIGMLGSSILFGLFLNSVEPVHKQIVEKVNTLKTRFLIQEKKIVQKKIESKKPEKIKKIEPIKPKEKPVDLTKKPELKQKDEDVQKKDTKVKKVRRVYGLKKVYSRGIGSGGSLSDAVVGKLGNTLKKEVDTLLATDEELKGEVVSVTTISIPPKFLKRVKPQYSQEMLENSVEGVVKVKVLVDIDGKIKKAIALNDIGYGAADLARKTCFKFLFEPAQRDGVSVAVWIIIPIRFVLIG